MAENITPYLFSCPIETHFTYSKEAFDAANFSCAIDYEIDIEPHYDAYLSPVNYLFLIDIKWLSLGSADGTIVFAFAGEQVVHFQYTNLLCSKKRLDDVTRLSFSAFVSALEHQTEGSPFEGLTLPQTSFPDERISKVVFQMNALSNPEQQN